MRRAHPAPRRGQAHNLGPVAGTGARTGIPGIAAADLGEVVRLPDGRYVAVFGDAFSGSHVGADPHYPSVAVPVEFDDHGRPRFGDPLTGPDGGPNVLFPPPRAARGRNTLPAGSIELRDGTTYLLVVGTMNLIPDGGSWLVKVTNNPARGWKPVARSWRPWTSAAGLPGTSPASHPTQISGYQAADGAVYIAADAFDRSRPVTMYRVDPAHVPDRSAWQPWTGTDWGPPGEVATTPLRGSDRYGELSFRGIEGRPVLSGFNCDAHGGAVQVWVGSGSPVEVFDKGHATIALQQSDPNRPNFLPQNYGGYLLPRCTLDNVHLFGSQWHTPRDEHGNPSGPQIYNTQHIVINPHR